MKNLIIITVIVLCSGCSTTHSLKSFDVNPASNHRNAKLNAICSHHGGVQYYDKLAGAAQCRDGFYAWVK
jgi:uncharacterized protein YceK